jgi:hypothetical protein
MTLLALN